MTRRGTDYTRESPSHLAAITSPRSGRRRKAQHQNRVPPNPSPAAHSQPDHPQRLHLLCPGCFTWYASAVRQRGVRCDDTTKWVDGCAGKLIATEPRQAKQSRRSRRAKNAEVVAHKGNTEEQHTEGQSA